MSSKNKIFSGDPYSVEIFRKYVTNIIKSLDIPTENKAKLDNDFTINAIKTFEKHTLALEK